MDVIHRLASICALSRAKFRGLSGRECEAPRASFGQKCTLWISRRLGSRGSFVLRDWTLVFIRSYRPLVTASRGGQTAGSAAAVLECGARARRLVADGARANFVRRPDDARSALSRRQQCQPPRLTGLLRFLLYFFFYWCMFVSVCAPEHLVLGSVGYGCVCVCVCWRRGRGNRGSHKCCVVCLEMNADAACQ